MNVEAIAAIDVAESSALGGIGSQPFSQHLQTEFLAVNNKIAVAESELQALATGEQNNVHHVMLALEDARMSFQLIAQIRNRVLDAYQDIMRMQV